MVTQDAILERDTRLKRVESKETASSRGGDSIAKRTQRAKKDEPCLMILMANVQVGEIPDGLSDIPFDGV